MLQLIFCLSQYFLIIRSYELVANEEYRCDLPCEQSCETLDVTYPCIGERQCKNFCLPGYVRDSRDGSCISPFQCPSCFGNETYRGAGYDCLTCQNYDTTRCPIHYRTKCYCLDGYVRNSRGRCILPKDCPNEGTECTKPNEKFTSCYVKACERSCGSKARPCPRLCRESACICKRGFVRDDQSGECIDESYCPVLRQIQML